MSDEVKKKVPHLMAVGSSSSASRLAVTRITKKSLPVHRPLPLPKPSLPSSSKKKKPLGYYAKETDKSYNLETKIKQNIENKLTGELQTKLIKEIEERLRKELTAVLTKEIEEKLRKEFEARYQNQKAISLESDEHESPAKAVHIETRRNLVAAVTPLETKVHQYTEQALIQSEAAPEANVPETVQAENIVSQEIIEKETTAEKPATKESLPQESDSKEIVEDSGSNPEKPITKKELAKNALEIENANTVSKKTQSNPSESSYNLSPDTQPIPRVKKRRVSLEEIDPANLIGPQGGGDISDLLRDAGIYRSRSSSFFWALLLLTLLIAGALALYYTFGRPISNPPQTGVKSAAFVGFDRGSTRFPEGDMRFLLSQQNETPSQLLREKNSSKKAPTKVLQPIPSRKTPNTKPETKNPPPKPIKPPNLRVVPR